MEDSGEHHYEFIAFNKEQPSQSSGGNEKQNAADEPIYHEPTFTSSSNQRSTPASLTDADVIMKRQQLLYVRGCGRPKTLALSANSTPLHKQSICETDL